MTIGEIAKACGGVLGNSVNAGDFVTEICTDSRKLTPGSLFVALAGERYDGHDFAEKAVEMGAKAVLCHKSVNCGREIIVRDTRVALGDIARYYRMKFPDIKLVGITGSVGKTTTKEMIYSVLSSTYLTHKTSGNLNNDIGLPMTMFGLSHEHEAAVIEMGMSHFGEIEYLAGICRPTIAVITNIGVSHIENLGSRENILKAKMEILSGMAQGAPVLLNGDDGLLSAVTIENHRLFYYGINSEECTFKAVNIDESGEGSEFDIRYDGDMYHVKLHVPGQHNILDAVAAFGAGILAGVEPAAAAAALERYEPCGMRQNIVDKDGITIIEDCYNASPDSMRASLTTLNSMKGRRKIAVLSDMLELGSFSGRFHREIGEYAAQNADILICCGEYARDYVKGFIEAGKSSAKYYEKRDEMADELYRLLEKGDVVLFKASRGMRLEKVIADLYSRWSE